MHSFKKRANGEYQFGLNATNGQNTLRIEDYTTKSACENGIESIRKNSTEGSRFEHKVSSNNKFYFNLKATKVQTIVISEMYESEVGRDNAIASVQNNAPDATVDDQTG
ncbi:MAG: YegP family protein [Phycisphaerales bacterium]|nr:YegP family protein [Phycisphaerales bacterium]